MVAGDRLHDAVGQVPAAGDGRAQRRMIVSGDAALDLGPGPGFLALVMARRPLGVVSHHHIQHQLAHVVEQAGHIRLGAGRDVAPACDPVAAGGHGDGVLPQRPTLERVRRQGPRQVAISRRRQDHLLGLLVSQEPDRLVQRGDAPGQAIVGRVHQPQEAPRHRLVEGQHLGQCGSRQGRVAEHLQGAHGDLGERWDLSQRLWQMDGRVGHETRSRAGRRALARGWADATCRR